MPFPAARAHKALLAVLAAMAIVTGLIPSLLITDHGLPAVTQTAARRPDDDEEDETEDTETETESEEDEETETETEDEVNEDELPDNVKAILKKERKARRDAEKALRTERRTSKPAAKAKPKAKPKPSATDDTSEADEATRAADERATKATGKLQRANLISALGKSKHGLIDPAAAAKLAIQDGIAEFDDDDEPVGVDDLVKDLVDDYAFLKGTAAKPKPRAPDIDGGDKKSRKAPKLTADELEMATSLGMTPDEYATYKDPNPKLPAKKPAAK